MKRSKSFLAAAAFSSAWSLNRPQVWFAIDSKEWFIPVGATMPTKSLTANTGYMITPTAFLYALLTLRARLRIRLQPIRGCSFTSPLVLPTLPHLTRARRVRFIATSEAETFLANASHFERRIGAASTFQLYCVPTMWRGWTPRNIDSAVLADIGLQKSATETRDCIGVHVLHSGGDQFVIAHNTAFERYAPQTARLALADLHQEVLLPARSTVTMTA